ncbi:MAG TPA: hypothetical protein DIW30_06200 [Bacteroidales bacterium]|nr:hypothetical protein [Bacteroidales bacterium]
MQTLYVCIDYTGSYCTSTKSIRPLKPVSSTPRRDLNEKATKLDNGDINPFFGGVFGGLNRQIANNGGLHFHACQVWKKIVLLRPLYD